MKVAIIAGGTINDIKAVLDLDESWEIWGLNNITPNFVPRWDRWFNLHHYKTLRKEWPRGLASELAWAHMNPELPCYVLESWNGKIPKERIFPRRQLAKMPRGGYHCSSIDWMIAFAVLLGAKEISLHGVGLAFERGEPISAHPCFEYWCGYAEGRGIKVHTHDCNCFYNYRLVRDRKAYGYDDWDLVEDLS